MSYPRSVQSGFSGNARIHNTAPVGQQAKLL
jgi:hypothetical protein